MMLYTPNGGGVIETDNEATIKSKLAMGFTTDAPVVEVEEVVDEEVILDEEQ